MLKRLLPVIAIIIFAVYAYKTKMFQKLDADIKMTATEMAILARDKTYHNCKIHLSGDYQATAVRINRKEHYYIPINEFKQWNGTALSSISDLPKPYRIELSCDEGRLAVSR